MKGRLWRPFGTPVSAAQAVERMLEARGPLRQVGTRLRQQALVAEPQVFLSCCLAPGNHWNQSCGASPGGEWALPAFKQG